jgi:4'-phosphopantetheinyl transferase
MNFTRLHDGIVQIWYSLPETINNPELLSEYRRLMSADERLREKRFRFEKDRHIYVVTRALIRTVLSKYSSIDPCHWQFEENQYGRPELLKKLNAPSIRFNLSHTSGMVACVVALDRDVGIDVEDLTRETEILELADRFFSQEEAAALRELPREDQTERFFSYWTLKESYIKALGIGLSMPLDRFSFHLERGYPIRISFGSEVAGDPATWQFAQFRLTSRHIVAVSIRRPRDPDLRIELRKTVPLLD